MTRGYVTLTIGRLTGALLMAAGLALSLGCAFGEDVTPVIGDGRCPLGAVDVSGTEARHVYKYTLLDCGGDLSGQVAVS